MAKFCGKCGAELNKQGMCPVCDSAPVKPEGKDDQPAKKKVRFCGKCGGPLNLQTGRCPHCDGPEETPIDTAPPKKGHHTALLIGTIAAVLLAVAAVVGVLVHFGVLNIPAVAKLEENLGLNPRPSADGTAVDQPVEVDLVTRMDTYDANDALIWYQTYTYDDMGQRNSVTSYDSAGNQTGYVDLSTGDSYWYASCTGEVGARHCTTVKDGDTQTVTFENGSHEVTVYDADGRETMIYRYAADADDYYEYAVYEYNEDGQLMKINDYLASDGSLCAYTTYEYNEQGQRVRYETFDGRGRTVSSTTASYNEAGDIARSDYFTSNGQLEYYCLYEYTTTSTAS